MGLEMERRFLVLDMDRSIDLGKGTKILQGYLEVPFPEQSLRVRFIDSKKAIITKKIGAGERRDERNRPINLGAAKLLLESCSDFLEKIRYCRDGWEIDFFHSPLYGIILAECEFKIKKEIKLPPWIFKAIDVTESLSNVHLARLASDLRGTSAEPLLAVHELISEKVCRIVLTGGPCSGKSQIIDKIRKEMGDRVHCVPEVATIIISQVEVSPPKEGAASRRFSRTIYRVQRIFEATSAEYALSQKKQALVLDRGTIDTAAYMSNGLDEMEDICQTTRAFEFAQYDLVICLDVAPEQVYKAKCRDNPARSETYQQASALGQKIKEVWQAHHNFHFISNNRGWAEKENVALQLIESFLNVRH